MGYKDFFGFRQNEVRSKLELHVEEIAISGYAILENVVDESMLQIIRDKLDLARERQIQEYGEERLRRIRDFGTVRCLPNEDSFFVDKIALNEDVYGLVSAILGDTCILHLQNGIIIYPNNTKHNEGNWHRDFQKPFFSSKELSLNALWVIDEFNAETGGTWIVPNTHNMEAVPSEEFINGHKLQVSAKPGSVIVFNSMMWHRGGDNYSSNLRRAINNQYTRPFIKQQIDLPAFLGSKYDKDSKAGQLLGYWSIPPKSVAEFRVDDPLSRTYRGGQG